MKFWPFSDEELVNGAKRAGQTQPNLAKCGQTEPNGAKGGQTGPRDKTEPILALSLTRPHCPISIIVYSLCHIFHHLSFIRYLFSLIPNSISLIHYTLSFIFYPLYLNPKRLGLCFFLLDHNGQTQIKRLVD